MALGKADFDPLAESAFEQTWLLRASREEATAALKVCAGEVIVILYSRIREHLNQGHKADVVIRAASARPFDC